MNLSPVLLVLSSYALGGIPSGYIVARRLKGIDIREHGSGNPGAANVYRVVGPVAGLITLAADALKGFVPVLLAARLYPGDSEVAAACGAMAIVGHLWTVFLKLRGGKGVATTAGVFLALLPVPMVPTIVIFAAGMAFTGHISIGSISAALVFPFFALLSRAPLYYSMLAFAACGLILYKHIPNVKRLMNVEKHEQIQ